MPDEIDLSPEDEKALDAAWAQIAREDREAAAAQQPAPVKEDKAKKTAPGARGGAGASEIASPGRTG